MTIGSGIDLGQMKESDLNKLGLPQALNDKLIPYLDKKEDRARAVLTATPLHLSEEEVAQLNAAKHQSDINKLIENYNDDVDDGETQFHDLPQGIQTAIGSVGTQWGPKFGNRRDSASSRTFWDKVTNLDWQGASQVLRQWGTNIPAYATRRNAEADLIDGAHGSMAATPSQTPAP